MDDAPTLESLTVEAHDSELITLGELTIESKGHLSLGDIYNSEYDVLSVEAGSVRVTVWSNDDSEPCEVTFLVQKR